jgi:hypothetical protein
MTDGAKGFEKPILSVHTTPIVLEIKTPKYVYHSK